MSKVIIVGAGASGLACGIVAARKGHEVVILEKIKTYLRDTTIANLVKVINFFNKFPF